MRVIRLEERRPCAAGYRKILRLTIRRTANPFHRLHALTDIHNRNGITDFLHFVHIDLNFLSQADFDTAAHRGDVMPCLGSIQLTPHPVCFCRERDRGNGMTILDRRRRGPPLPSPLLHTF